MPTQADADPVAVVYQWLHDHPATPGLLGGPEHVSGIPESPWPHVAVSGDTSGDLRTGWDAEHEVILEVIGAPDGAPGQSDLRRLAFKVLDQLRELPDTDVLDPTVPVVSKVLPSGTFAWAPLTGGQPRYVLGVLVTIRPPLS